MSERAYLLLGPETGEKEQRLKEIRNALRAELGEDPELHRFYPFETENGEILTVLNNNSLFSEHRLVILSQAENLNASLVTALDEYLAHPVDTATLVIISSETSIAAKLMKAVPKKNTQIFYELFDNQKADWVRTFFRRWGLTVTGEAVDLLLDLVENNTAELRTMCSQLALFWQTGDKNAPIDEDAVQTYIHHSRQEDAFTLFPHMAKGDLKQSLETLHAILGSGDSSSPILVVSGLLWQFRRLMSIQEEMSTGSSEMEAFSRAKVQGKSSAIRNPRDKGTYHTALQNYSLIDLRRVITTLAEADIEVKESGTEMTNLMLERMLYRIVSLKGKKFASADFASF